MRLEGHHPVVGGEVQGHAEEHRHVEDEHEREAHPDPHLLRIIRVGSRDAVSSVDGRFSVVAKRPAGPVNGQADLQRRTPQGRRLFTSLFRVLDGHLESARFGVGRCQG